MGVAAARALAPTVSILDRQPAAEQAALHALACWAGRFTPRVSLAGDDTLLLDVGRCLRLFGGVGPLVDQVRTGVAEQGFALRFAMAPTPLGARWLARWASPAVTSADAGDGAAAPVDSTVEPAAGWLCRSLANLRPGLDALSVACLAPAAAEALQSFGATTLGAARRLPMADLARRIGNGAVLQLAQAYGEVPDPRPDFVFPDTFALGLELPATVESAPALLFAARRLTGALAGWLAARQAGIAACTLHLQHRRGSTPLALGFAGRTRDPQRFERVLKERLDRLRLASPVEALRLEASRVDTLPGRSDTLFAGEGSDTAEGMGALLERLQARLGAARVYGLATVADHRPECATRPVVVTPEAASPKPRGQPRAGQGGNASTRGKGSVRPPLRSGAGAELVEGFNPNGVAGRPSSNARPCWLLPQPQPIEERRGRPHYRGPLLLLAGPERIESGWWDAEETDGSGQPCAGDLRRDYFVALSPDQRWLWIYRDLAAPGGWFLHGLFA